MKTFASRLIKCKASESKVECLREYSIVSRRSLTKDRFFGCEAVFTEAGRLVKVKTGTKGQAIHIVAIYFLLFSERVKGVRFIG